MFRYIVQFVRSGVLVLAAVAVHSPHVASAANRYWDGTGTSWNVPAAWSTASGATTPNPGLKPGAADTAIFNITTVNTPQTVNLNLDPNLPTNQSALGLVFNSTGSVLIQSGAGGPNTLTLGAGGITSNVGAGADTISAPIILAAPQTWLNDGNKVTVSGNVTNGANLLTINGASSTTISGVLGNGSGGLTKNGAGQLVLSNSNTFTGGVTINGGSVRLDHPGALNSTTPNAVAFGPASTGVLSLNGNNVTVSSLSTNASVGTPIVQNANPTPATLTLNGAGPFDFNGVLQDGPAGGALSLVKSGTGTLLLGGNNTFTGGISVTGGDINISAGGTLNTGAGLFLINNTGTVTVDNTGNLNADGDVTVDGGELNIDPNGSFQLAAGKTFTLQNGGLALGIQPNSTNANYIIGTGASWTTDMHIQNGAQVNVTSGGMLKPITLVINNGVLHVSSPGSFEFNLNTISQFIVNSNSRATFDLNGGLYRTLPLFATGIGSYNISGTNSKFELVNGSGLLVTNSCTVNVGLGGLLSVAAELLVENGGRLNNYGGTVIADSFSVEASVLPGGGFSFDSGTLGVTGAAGLTLADDNVGKNFTLSPTRTLNVTNTTTIPVGGSLAITGGTLSTGSLINNGAFNYSSGTLGITGPSGFVVGAGGLFGSTLVFNANQTFNVTNMLTVDAGAYLAVAGGLNAGNLVNNGDLVVINTAIDAPVVNNFQVTVVGSVDFNGLVSGPGDFYGPGTAHFNGGLAPGASPDEVTFEGSLALAATNTLFMEIGGTTPGSEYDRLSVTGSATLDGILSLDEIDIGGGVFQPQLGDMFEIVSAASLMGTFDDVIPNGLDPWLDYDVHYDYVNGTVTLETVRRYSADFDFDGDVDGDDLAQWQGDYSLNGLSDADEDGDSDGADFLQWQQQFGSGVGPLAANVAVPEPSSWMLLSLAAVGGKLPRRRRIA